MGPHTILSTLHDKIDLISIATLWSSYSYDPFLYSKKLGHREAKSNLSRNSASEWKNQDSNLSGFGS